MIECLDYWRCGLVEYYGLDWRRNMGCEDHGIGIDLILWYGCDIRCGGMATGSSCEDHGIGKYLVQFYDLISGTRTKEENTFVVG